MPFARLKYGLIYYESGIYRLEFGIDFAFKVFFFAQLCILFNSCISSSGSHDIYDKKEAWQKLCEVEPFVDRYEIDTSKELLEKWRKHYGLSNLMEDSLSKKWYLLAGKTEYYSENFIQAADYFSSAIDLIETIDRELDSDIYFALLEIYLFQYDEGAKGILLADFENKMDTTQINDHTLGLFYSRVAQFYQDIDYQVFEDYYDKASKIINRIEDVNLKVFHYLIPFQLELTGLSDQECIDSLFKIKDYVQKANNILNSKYYEILGDYHWNKKDWDGVMEFSIKEYEHALKIEDPIEKLSSLGNAYINLSDAYLNKRKYGKALKYIDTAKLFINFMNKGDLRPLFSNQLELYHRLNYPVDSLTETYWEFYDKMDSILRHRFIRELHTVTKNLESEQLLLSERSLLLKNRVVQQRNFAILLSTSILIASLIGFYYYREKKLRLNKQKEMQLIQAKMLSTQIKPHFLNNTMGHAMALAEETSPETYDYIAKLAQLFRHTFNYAQNNFVSLEEELNILKEFYYLENSKVDSRQNRLSIQNKTRHSISNLYIPALILQPLLENAIQFKDSNRENHIEIIIQNINEHNNTIDITIEDTGEGYCTK